MDIDSGLSNISSSIDNLSVRLSDLQVLPSILEHTNILLTIISVSLFLNVLVKLLILFKKK